MSTVTTGRPAGVLLPAPTPKLKLALLDGVTLKVPLPVMFNRAVVLGVPVGAVPMLKAPLKVNVVAPTSKTLSVVELLDTVIDPNVLLLPRVKLLPPLLSDPISKLLAPVPLMARP